MRLERLLTTALLLPIMPSVTTFSTETKHKIAQNADYHCEYCGLPTMRGQCHHDLPQFYGGSDKVENGHYLCGEKDKDCHEIFDRQALDEGILFDGRPIKDADPVMIKSRSKFEKAIDRFRPKNKHQKHQRYDFDDEGDITVRSRK